MLILYPKFYSEHIPILEANVSRLGFIASSSFSSPGYEPYGAFNNLNADGANDLGLHTQFLAGYKFNVLNLLKSGKSH
jgi:hypothetical protein